MTEPTMDTLIRSLPDFVGATAGTGARAISFRRAEVCVLAADLALSNHDLLTAESAVLVLDGIWRAAGEICDLPTAPTTRRINDPGDLRYGEDVYDRKLIRRYAKGKDLCEPIRRCRDLANRGEWRATWEACCAALGFKAVVVE